MIDNYTQAILEDYDNKESAYNDIESDDLENVCCFCNDLKPLHELKLINGVFVCLECETSPDTLNEFVTIEKAIAYYKKHKYIK